jgi:Glyoxalase-like domain
MAMGFQVTLDCAEPRALAEFWAATLGYKPADPPAGFSSWEEWAIHMEVPKNEWDDGAWIDDPDGHGPRLCFLRVPEPKTAKNRMHLDLDASDGRSVEIERRMQQVDEHVERVVALGGRMVRAFESTDHYHVVMQDPEGNEFCVR